jgi:tetratricopeptide (TPR) repeat protein
LVYLSTLMTRCLFLINNEIDINEGLKFVDEALGLSPDNFNYLDTKAWGLYKQGKYEEAKRFIEKADSLKPINYDYTIFIHKQEIEKAIQGQKNN